jgi:glycosyltransferase involved in cell wall biosynthesis
MKAHSESTIGVVVIGRNEGERLKRCLRSLQAQLPEQLPIVYVDSGSTDGSLDFARSLGVHVIELEMTQPFTAARARNRGWQHLLRHFPDLDYVQFIDGDCELVPDWLQTAVPWLDQAQALAIVFGRNHEMFPQASLYHQLADMEWNASPIGETEACGGIMLMRVAALKAVDGFNGALICGEEPEMCIRLRRQGWKIRRIDADMSYHDIDMHHFGQWWRRSIRNGWSVAEGFVMHGASPERYMVKGYWSGWFWGAVIPGMALLLLWPTQGISLGLLLCYPILMYRVYGSRRRKCGDAPRPALLYALFCTLFKFPQVIGHCQYWLVRWQRRTPTLIEYKTSS